MSCDEARRWISRRVDGEEPSSRGDAGGRAVEDHLARCASCRNLFASEVRRADTLRAALAAPPGETGRLAGEILRLAAEMPGDGAPAPIRSPRFRPALGMAAAAVVAAAGLVWVLLPDSPAGRDPGALPQMTIWVPRIRVEEELEGSRVVPGADGAPWGSYQYVLRRVEDPGAGAPVIRSERAGRVKAKMVDFPFR